MFGHADQARAAVLFIWDHADVPIAFHAADDAGQVLAADHQVPRQISDTDPPGGLRSGQRSQHRPLLGGQAFAFHRT